MAQDRAPFDAIDLDSPVAIDKLAAELATKRVVFVGEIHNRYDHHLNQLEIVRLLHNLDSNLAIGVEYFPQTVQQQVDDYIAGRTSEQEFLRATDYFKNWGYDYRLYAPIFRYAREQHIPVRALNVPNELPSAVAKVGVAGLSESQRKYLPREREPADDAYRTRLRGAFQAHGPSKPGDFEHFVEAQLVWDEGMAESAAAYLEANPGRRIVILVGAGHLEFGSGIPKRLERRTHATYAIVLSSGEAIEPHMADYLLLSEKQELPPAGILGVNLEDKNDECRIKSLSPGGAAEKAGLKKGDVLLAVDGQTVKATTDVRLVTWDKKPGDHVRIKFRRKRAEREVEVELAAAAPSLG
ncbi:MAG TPA: ChaN family lipoprotein [Bryobacteraceae bacterium]|nr:ChaN family lipoprotein [Bryobacteraceae bacterium]